MNGYPTKPLTKQQDQALREWLQESIVPLIEQVLVKKIGQAMQYAAEELIQPKCDRIHCRCGLKSEWQGLTDDEVSKILDDVIGFNSCWGPETEFARAIEAKLKEKNS
jgi:hypothetical protein